MILTDEFFAQNSIDIISNYDYQLIQGRIKLSWITCIDNPPLCLSNPAILDVNILAVSEPRKRGTQAVQDE